MEDTVPIGSVLDGRYRIEAILGSGGMGKVYRAQHSGIGRTVAIKVLHNDLSKNPEAAQRFQREAIASGRLDHPNIVGVTDSGVLGDGSCYLVMEALEGESLGERLDREHSVKWPEAVEIIKGVLRGLAHAHEKGVVHRDIKPDNIFLARKDGAITVKILDFGIAKLYAGNANDPASTRAGLTVGTPAYLSPEQAVGGEITPSADLYSTTVVLFEMLAGRTPFYDPDPLAMLGMHVGKDPPRLADVAPNVALPSGLEGVVAHGLGKLASERIASTGEYLARLDALGGNVRDNDATLVNTAPPPPMRVRDASERTLASSAAEWQRGGIDAPTLAINRTPAPMPPANVAISAKSMRTMWIVLAAIIAIGIIAAIAGRGSSDKEKPRKASLSIPSG